MGPVGIGWGVRVGCLACTGTPGPVPHPAQSGCPEQHKTSFEQKREEHIPRGAEPVLSRSGPGSPTPHAGVPVTWWAGGWVGY